MKSVKHLIKTRIRRILNFINKSPNSDQKLNTYQDLEKKSLIEIYAALRHEAHRLEKSVYNNLITKKQDIYRDKHKKIQKIQKLIITKDPNANNNPVFNWSRKISESFPEIRSKFIDKFSEEPQKVNISQGEEIIKKFQHRRSCRVLNKELDSNIINQIIPNLISAAKWAPNSGNRQAVRLKFILSENEKKLLIGLKEEHCYTAPLLTFVGIDKRLYGALSSFEECMYLDAAAAITQMILYIDSVGLGASWNHFGLDMINSRESNREKFKIFKKELKIPDYIMPIAILAIGEPKYLTPVPERMPDNSFLL